MRDKTKRGGYSAPDADPWFTATLLLPLGVVIPVVAEFACAVGRTLGM